MTPESITIDGRSGSVVYLDANWHPVPAAKATMAKVVFDDGGTAFFTVAESPAPEPEPPPDPHHLTYREKLAFLLGGAGSGNFGHAGRPGEVGGSAEGDSDPIEALHHRFVALVKKGEDTEDALNVMRNDIKAASDAWRKDITERKRPLKADGAAAKKLDSYKKMEALSATFHAAYDEAQKQRAEANAQAKELLKVPHEERSKLTFTSTQELHGAVEAGANRALATFRQYDGSGAFVPHKYPGDQIEKFREIFGDKTPLVTNPDGTFSIPATLRLGRAKDGRANATLGGINIGTARELDRTVYHEIAHHIEMNHSAVLKAAVELRESLATKPREVYALNTVHGGLDAHEHALRGNFPDPYSAKLYPDDIATEMVSTGVEAYIMDPIGFSKSRPEHFKFIFDVMHGKYRSKP
jgi:hypothetical protein